MYRTVVAGLVLDYLRPIVRIARLSPPPICLTGANLIWSFTVCVTEGSFSCSVRYVGMMTWYSRLRSPRSGCIRGWRRFNGRLPVSSALHGALYTVQQVPPRTGRKQLLSHCYWRSIIQPNFARAQMLAAQCGETENGQQQRRLSFHHRRGRE